MQWIEQTVNDWGGTVVYVSGYRTRAQQQELWESRQGWLGRLTGRPVAPPGCSQHNYEPSYAVDIRVVPAHGEGGIDVRDWDNFITSLGNYVGVTTVRNDPGHYQMYPGAQFGQWATDSGLCNPGQRFHFQATSVSCDLLGCQEFGQRSDDRWLFD